MAVNLNPPAQVPADNRGLIGSFPEDKEIVVSLCKAMKCIADTAVLKRKEEFYFEAIYALEQQLFNAWINIVADRAAISLLSNSELSS